MAQASKATAAATRNKPRVDICCRWFDTPLITVKDVMKGKDRLGDGSANWQFAPLDQRSLCQAQALSSVAQLRSMSDRGSGANCQFALPCGAGGLRVCLAGQLFDQ